MKPFVYIENEQVFYELCAAMNTCTVLGIDTETSGSLDPHTNRLVLMSLFVQNTRYVIDIERLGIDMLQFLKPVLENDQIVKVGHNIVYDYKVIFKKTRIEMRNLYDTMTADRMLNAGFKMQFSLKDVAKRRLGIERDKTIRDEFINIDSTHVFTDEQLDYAAEDAENVVRIREIQLEEIEVKNLQRIADLEMSILPCVAFMELTGIYVDVEELRAMIEPFERFIRIADKAFQDLLIQYGAAESILVSRDGYQCVNSRSPEQVKEALCTIGIEIRDQQGKLSLSSKIIQRWDLQQKKKKGKTYRDFDVDYHTLVDSDDDDVATALDLFISVDNPIVRAYVFLVGARKLFSTYVIGVLNAVNPTTGKVHPYFNSYGAMATGRFSSTGPNFQNLPNDEKLAKLGLGAYSLRRCIKVGKGRKLIITDYSAIELVILAALSEDDKLMNEILRGDIHTLVCREVVGYKEITKANKNEEPYKTWRKGSKTLSYAIIYGTTGRNVAETLNVQLGNFGYKITAQDGDKLIDAWYKLFPKTALYLQKNANKAVIDGYVTDTWGRRRHWDVSTFSNKWLRLAAMREGCNMPIQGTCATMVKLAMLYSWQKLDRSKARIIITVHDEIVIESIDSYAEEACDIIKWSMEQAIKDTLPMVAQDVGNPQYESLCAMPKISHQYDK